MALRSNKKQYDLTRNDKFYELSIPKYTHYKECVFYEVHLKDLVKSQTYIHEFRYKQMKQYHDTLIEMKIELPQFPKTHFWKKTNKHPEMIRQRQVYLQKYFAVIINDPFIRGYQVIKKFIKTCKIGNRNNRWFSNKKEKRVLSTTKSKSLSNRASEVEVNLQIKKMK